MAIVAAAVAALAQPLLLARPRLAAWNARTARAIVVDVSDSMRTSVDALSEAADAAKAEGQGTVYAARIEAATLGSGVLQAVEQLDTAPRARREIVIVSDFQRGALSRGDLDAVPPAIGIRLVQVGAATRERKLRGLVLFHPGPGFPNAQEILLSENTTAVSVVRGSGSREGLSLMSADADNGAIPALERAVASAGAPAPSSEQPLAIGFAGNPRTAAVRQISATWMLETVLRMQNDRDLLSACSEPVSAVVDPGSAGRTQGASNRGDSNWYVLCRDPELRPVVRAAATATHLVLDVEAPPSALLSAAVVRAALTARHGVVARPEEEIQRMTAAELTSWSRQAAPVGAGTWRSGWAGSGPSDNRWCWALALMLLAVESIVRGRNTGSGKSGRPRTDAPHEVRVDAA
jgi:hypothetical protein